MRKTKAEGQLDEMLMTLHSNRSGLETARESGRPGWIDTAQRAVRSNHASIRIHCAENNLPVPMDIPISD